MATETFKERLASAAFTAGWNLVCRLPESVARTVKLKVPGVVGVPVIVPVGVSDKIPAPVVEIAVPLSEPLSESVALSLMAVPPV